MKPILATGLLLAAATNTIALAQHAGIRRTELQRHAISVPGHAVVQARVELAAGAAIPRHTHPGEEVGYVLDGMLELRIDGQPPVTLARGQAFLVPAGLAHSARNVGTGGGAALVTYIVEQDKPLAVPAQ